MKIKQIIRNFFSTSVSTEEQELLSEWKDESVKNVEVLQQLVKIQALDLKDYTTYDVEEAWNSVQKNIDETPSFRTENNTRVRPLWASYVAAAAVFLSVAGVGLYYFSGQSPDTTSDTSRYISQASKKDINLSDGSDVYMDTHSTVDVINPRELKLSGRAYFDIEEDKEHPFMVHTSTGSIKVLGTEFSIISDSTSTEVYVTEGVVQYTDDYRSVILKKGDYLKAEGKDVVKVQKDEGNYLAWHSEKLKFRNTSLVDAIEDINRFYDIKVEISQSTKSKNCRITSSYKGKTAKEVLNELRDILGLKYQKRGNTIVIVEAKC